MHASAISAAALFASLSSALSSPRDTSSFTLYVNSTFDNSARYLNVPVLAVHSGAAIEALAVFPDSTPTTFTSTGVLQGTDSPFYIHYELPSTPNPPDDEILQLYNNGTGNEQFLFFGTGQSDAEFVRAEEDGQIGIYTDADGQQYVFWVCPQETLGYDYETVTWVEGLRTPTDPKCAEVALYQQF